LAAEDPEGAVRTHGLAFRAFHHSFSGALTGKRCDMHRVQEFHVLNGATELIECNSGNPMLTIGYWMPEVEKFRIMCKKRAFDHMQEVHLVPQHLEVPQDDHTSLTEVWKLFHGNIANAASNYSSPSSNVCSHASDADSHLYDDDGPRANFNAPFPKTRLQM